MKYDYDKLAKEHAAEALELIKKNYPNAFTAALNTIGNKEAFNQRKAELLQEDANLAEEMKAITSEMQKLQVEVQTINAKLDKFREMYKVRDSRRTAIHREWCEKYSEAAVAESNVSNKNMKELFFTVFNYADDSDFRRFNDLVRNRCKTSNIFNEDHGDCIWDIDSVIDWLKDEIDYGSESTAASELLACVKKLNLHKN